MEGALQGIAKPTEADWQRAFPVSPVDWQALANPQAGTLQALWVGHATALVQVGGYTFVTDPLLSERCSPAQFFGPKRNAPPAITFTEPQLPPLDFVLLSHNHYDHLDKGSVRTLHKRYGQALKWYVPLGVAEWFASEGVRNVVELDWWQCVEHTSPGRPSLKITSVPAQHWSARGVLDRFKTLWCGYVVEAPSTHAAAAKGEASAPQRLFFAGDTGYCEVFKEIGERLGPMDLALIPIGAYEPRWFMKPQHVDAVEGVQIARDVRAHAGIAIHHGTFCLTDEPMDEPATKLAEELHTKGLPQQLLMAVRHGEMAVVGQGGQLLNSPKLLPVPPQ